MTDDEQQQVIHDAILEGLRGANLIPDDRILTGWVVCIETLHSGGDRAMASSIYGPAGMTSWRARGLMDWSRPEPDDPTGDEEDE